MNQVRVFIWLFGAIAGFSHAALNTEDKNLIVSAASKAGGEENERWTPLERDPASCHAHRAPLHGEAREEWRW